MIKAIIEFMNNLDEDFKALAFKPSRGLHILINLNNENSAFIENYLYYDGEAELGSDFEMIAAFEKNSTYISMNQQQKFDNKQKIHSSSPFSLAFNFSLGNKKDEIIKELNAKIESGLTDKDLDTLIKHYKIQEIKTRIQDYFVNAKKLCLSEFDKSNDLLKIFELFLSNHFFDILPELTMKKNISKKKGEEIIENVSILKELKEKDYVRVYFNCIPIEQWAKAYNKYYSKEYPPNKLKENDFLTTYNQKKPFTIHNTATFETSLYISGKNTNALQEFKKILSVSPKRLLPNPLPIFISQDGIQEEMMNMYKKSDFSFGYNEIIERLWQTHKDDLKDYYLLNWTRAKEMLLDFDFVTKFDLELRDDFGKNWKIENFFKVKENKELKPSTELSNVFELESKVFKVLIGNKYKHLDYFTELDSEDFKDRKLSPNRFYDYTFLSYSKYRKSVYDYVYKSQRQSITQEIFKEMVFNGIHDNIKQNNPFAVREKLNIFFSLFEKFFSHFTPKTNTTMASNLINYRQFMEDLVEGKADLTETYLEKFAFAAGQIIYYLSQKSNTTDTNYQILEPYLQMTKCEDFKKVLANDFARHKHENFSERFGKAAAFVLTYKTEENLKKVLPEILAGVFSENCLSTSKINNSLQTI
jgi:CRISPR-associated protein Csh1